MKIKKQDLKQLISEIVSGRSHEEKKDFFKLLESWIGADAMPSKTGKAPLEVEHPSDEPAIVSPEADRQFADTDLPIGDDKWVPGNLKELGMAMKQLTEYIPEGQIGYFWPRVKSLIDKANENIDQTRISQTLPNFGDTSKL